MPHQKEILIKNTVSDMADLIEGLFHQGVDMEDIPTELADIRTRIGILQSRLNAKEPRNGYLRLMKEDIHIPVIGPVQAAKVEEKLLSLGFGYYNGFHLVCKPERTMCGVVGFSVCRKGHMSLWKADDDVSMANETSRSVNPEEVFKASSPAEL